MTPQLARKPPSARLFCLIWFSLLALTAASFLAVFRFGPLSKAIPFRQTPHGFETLPPLGSSVLDLRISDAGVVWVETFRGLNRFDVTSWRRFSTADTGMRL